jgi:hypothetical protein
VSRIEGDDLEVYFHPSVALLSLRIGLQHTTQFKWFLDFGRLSSAGTSLSVILPRLVFKTIVVESVFAEQVENITDDREHQFLSLPSLLVSSDKAIDNFSSWWKLLLSHFGM